MGRRWKAILYLAALAGVAMAQAGCANAEDTDETTPASVSIGSSRDEEGVEGGASDAQQPATSSEPVESRATTTQQPSTSEPRRAGAIVTIGEPVPAPPFTTAGDDEGLIFYVAELAEELLVLTPDGEELNRVARAVDAPFRSLYENALVFPQFSVRGDPHQVVSVGTAGVLELPADGIWDHSGEYRRFAVAGQPGDHQVYDFLTFTSTPLPAERNTERPAVGPNGAWLVGFDDRTSSVWLSRPDAPTRDVVLVEIPEPWELVRFGFVDASTIRVLYSSDDTLGWTDLSLDGFESVHGAVTARLALGLGSPALIPVVTDGPGPAFVDPATGTVRYSHDLRARTAPVPVGNSMVVLDEDGWLVVSADGDITRLAISTKAFNAVDVHGKTAYFGNSNGSTGTLDLVMYREDTGMVDVGAMLPSQEDTAIFSRWDLTLDPGADRAFFGTRHPGGETIVVIDQGHVLTVPVTGPLRSLDLSPDGTRILVTLGGFDTPAGLVMIDLASGSQSRLATLPEGRVSAWTTGQAR